MNTTSSTPAAEIVSAVRDTRHIPLKQLIDRATRDQTDSIFVASFNSSI